MVMGNQPIGIQQQQQQQQQQGVNIGMMMPNPMINQNQMADQKDLRHLLISPNPGQQATLGIGQPNINQIQQQQHQPQQTSQNWINAGQQGNVQQIQQPIQQQQLYMANQGGMPQQQQKPPQQQQNFQYYQ